MTIFIAFAEADRESAEGLETFLERRGHFVELDNGEEALRPVQLADVVVAVISKDFAFAPGRLRLEQRALDAWSEGRLILIKLDAALAPVGLRDLPFIDASFEPQREFKWGEVHNAIYEKLHPPPGAAAARAPAPLDGQAAAPPPTKSRGFPVLALLLLMLPGVTAVAAMVSIWLANRIGPSPGGLGDTIQGVDDLGIHYGAPAGAALWLFGIAIALMFGALIALIVNVARRGKPRAAKRAEAEEGAAAAGDPVFVSYARANASLVVPVIDAAKRDGRKFWLDQDGVGAGQGWAGEIVRAIRGAGDVLVMCSRAAFESDHVKREVYLADRYKKRLVPVFIEDAVPPEDFEYFFAGVQWLKLHETPEAERPAAVLRVLGTPS